MRFLVLAPTVLLLSSVVATPVIHSHTLTHAKRQLGGLGSVLQLVKGVMNESQAGAAGSTSGVVNTDAANAANTEGYTKVANCATAIKKIDDALAMSADVMSATGEQPSLRQINAVLSVLERSLDQCKSTSYDDEADRRSHLTDKRGMQYTGPEYEGTITVGGSGDEGMSDTTEGVAGMLCQARNDMDCSESAGEDSRVSKRGVSISYPQDSGIISDELPSPAEALKDKFCQSTPTDAEEKALQDKLCEMHDNDEMKSMTKTPGMSSATAKRDGILGNVLGGGAGDHQNGPLGGNGLGILGGGDDNDDYDLDNGHDDDDYDLDNGHDDDDMSGSSTREPVSTNYENEDMSTSGMSESMNVNSDRARSSTRRDTGCTACERELYGIVKELRNIFSIGNDKDDGAVVRGIASAIDSSSAGNSTMDESVRQSMRLAKMIKDQAEMVKSVAVNGTGMATSPSQLRRRAIGRMFGGR